MFESIWAHSVSILLWDWWTVRNKVNAGEREKLAAEVCSLIQRSCLDFNMHLAPSSVRDEEAPGLPTWKRSLEEDDSG
jgi:hypothetical protein